ncbi:hypothetical protein HK101_007914 [Irineochytrium annulatum]|nr:hypothetical protein HK101_007914 [Irineochytrium annulatum]
MGGGKVAPEESGNAGESADWTWPLMNSHMDIMGTCIAVYVPCIQHGQIVQREGWGSCMMGAILYGAAYSCGVAQCMNLWRREQIRRKYNIAGNIADDILASGACGTCALVQEIHQDSNPAQPQ